MNDLATSGELMARVALLEEALAEYALHFGLTERARALLVGPPSSYPLAGSHIEPDAVAQLASGATA